MRIPIGLLLVDELGSPVGEELVLPEALLRSLEQTPADGSLSRLEFPLAPGARWSVELKAYDPWAEGARLLQVDGHGARELPRAWRQYFLGTAKEDDAWRVGLWLDPSTGELGGVTSGPLGTFDLEATASGHRLMRSDVASPELTQSCANEKMPNLRGGSGSAGTGPSAAQALPRALLSSMATSASVPSSGQLGGGGGDPSFQAVIALDTDNEFHFKKFSNNTSAATAWIESLFTTMNVFYERDLDLNLVIGDTLFRLDTDPGPTFDDDPYTGGSGASSSQLNEFGNYWSANHGGIDRVLAALLSGKSSSGNSASGIAWIDGYCEKQNSGGGYSINQIFTNNVAVSNDARLVGHELGHNFDSDHTHCYTPPVDTCFSGESGCYSGSTSCPPGGQGTLMSYCHIGACGTTNKSEFHPTVIVQLTAARNAHFPFCITPFQPADQIFANGFEEGNLNEWD